MAAGLIDEELAAFLEGDGAQYLAVVGAGGTPIAGRAWGLIAPAGGASLRMIVGADAQTAAHVAPQGRIALCVTDIATFRSVQLKGTVLGVAEPDAAILASYAAYRTRFAAAVAANGGTTPMDKVWPARVIVVTVAVDALFDQTPGPNAGAGIGAAAP